MHDPQEWITRLNMSGKPLSKGQKRIAEYISCHYEKAVSMTAVMLGRQCGVSESTVVRFAMALGYEGYPEMQEKLRSMVRQRLTAEQRVGMMEETGRREVVSTVLKNDLQNLRKTMDELLAAGWDVGVVWQDGRAFHGQTHIRMNLALPLSRVQEAFRRLDTYVFNA